MIIFQFPYQLHVR